MTNSTSHSVKEPSGRSWESRAWFDAAAMEGVRYEIVRVSFGRRIELARRIREIGRRMEYLEAGAGLDKGAHETLEATVLSAEIDRAYLEWGLLSVEGFEIDGAAATPETLVDRGPVELAMEILGRIKAECGMSEDERKN
jgi:hypothetical protein